MRLTIDEETRQVVVEEAGERRVLDLFSREAFELVSREWVRIGWSQKYSYTFCWLGRPIIQLPEDIVRLQEVIYRLRPDVIIETGVAHGGSLIFHASLCKVLGVGRVIGIDIAIHPENRAAIESHELGSYITLVEGNSTDATIVQRVRSLIHPGERTLVVLDSNHTRQHVLDELEVYAPMVTPGSYIVATDGIMRDLADVPPGRPEWTLDNPAQAAREFAARHSEFRLERPTWPFCESALRQAITYWPDAWLQRIV